jgi:hypothetical protein
MPASVAQRPRQRSLAVEECAIAHILAVMLDARISLTPRN